MKKNSKSEGKYYNLVNEDQFKTSTGANGSQQRSEGGLSNGKPMGIYDYSDLNNLHLQNDNSASGFSTTTGVVNHQSSNTRSVKGTKF